MAELRKETSQEMGLHDEQLKGRTQKKFFSVDESENLTYFHSFDVDTSKTATIDALEMTPREINREIRELMEKGIGDITVDNPMSRHGVGVGILNRLNLTFSDSLGYFGCGLIDGPNVRRETNSNRETRQDARPAWYRTRTRWGTTKVGAQESQPTATTGNTTKFRKKTTRNTRIGCSGNAHGWRNAGRRRRKRDCCGYPRTSARK